jgi:hypothetical protein
MHMLIEYYNTNLNSPEIIILLPTYMRELFFNKTASSKIRIPMLSSDMYPRLDL